MSSKFDYLASQNLLGDYPSWIKSNVQYEVITGSVAYGCSRDSSDMDVYGFCIPPKHIIFPHLAGYIPGIGKAPGSFNQYQKHHIKDIVHKRVYDIAIYGIVSYFNLCMRNNPNLLDSLFCPQRCVLHITPVGAHMRSNRKLFLSKKSYRTFFEYAFSQLNKAEDKVLKQYVEFCKKYGLDPYTTTTEVLSSFPADLVVPKEEFDRGHKLINEVRKHNSIISKRLSIVIEHGFDTKFASHVVRLLLQVRQILEEHDLDIEANSEVLKAIRRGDWTLDRIKQYFSDQSRNLEEIYSKSTLRYSCDEAAIKKLLLECLEMHYGSLSNAVSSVKEIPQLVSEIEQVLQKYK